jgi:hypothetical protein
MSTHTAKTLRDWLAQLPDEALVAVWGSTRDDGTGSIEVIDDQRRTLGSLRVDAPSRALKSKV